MRPALPLLAFALLSALPAATQTWTADNGNGTFTNPLFYDEFSDPDLIRVGKDFYLTGTTMHSMPGLPILRSRDLVNWTFLGYALDKLDLGPAYHLEDNQNIYGQGIWAPCLRFHNGTFYIFSNVNRQTTQLFTATNPAGPWTRTPMKQSLHDLSVLFDDDGKTWVVWGYRDIRIAQLTADLLDIVPGTERILIPQTAGMGEGLHLYKVNGKYILTSAWYMDEERMPVARANSLEGPWEVNQNISRGEDFGVVQSYRIGGRTLNPAPGTEVRLGPPNHAAHGRLAMHQGGIVDTPTGEWWGFSMLDSNAIGRLTALSPVTWADGWPYFGLPGNLGRTPRIWTKPNTGTTDKPHAPYRRDDTFSTTTLQPVWQWNHIPLDNKWSLSERPGFLRLHTLPATSLWNAHNTLTQRAVGPRSQPTALLDTTGMKPGDIAGLALFNRPFAWLGVERTTTDLAILSFDEQTGKTERTPLAAAKVWLRATSDFNENLSQFSYSTDGKTFQNLGGKIKMPYGLITFQGVRDSLFAWNTTGTEGGYADFDAFTMNEANPSGLTRPIPYGKQIRLTPDKTFTVLDRGRGRVALRGKDGFLSTKEKPAKTETFQWVETFTGELTLLSLTNHRYLRLDAKTGELIPDSPGPLPDGKDGVRFTWTVVK